MGDAIKAGDLVMVVRACCHKRASESVGLVGTVIRLRQAYWRCSTCGREGEDKVEFDASKIFNSAPPSWLIKIDPPALPESAETHKELTV